MKRRNFFLLGFCALALSFFLFPGSGKVNAQEVTSTQTDAEESAQETEQEIIIPYARFVADSFHGVDALYRPGGWDGDDSTYSCAAYIKRYYEMIYGVQVNNLFGYATPNVEGSDYVETVSIPWPGDIVCERTDHGTWHWSIVKTVQEDGTITVIDQNFKWGGNVARIHRQLDPSNVRIYRLHSQMDLVDAIRAEEAAKEMELTTVSQLLQTLNQE